MAEELGGKALIDLIVEETVTCYAGRPHRIAMIGAMAAAHARPAICARRALRSGTRARMTYSRQGNVLHAAGRGRTDGARGGVPALCRLQSVDRPRAGPRQGGLHILRHRFRRHRRAGRRRLQDGGRTCACGRSQVAETCARQTLCRVHGRRTAAATRYAADRRAAPRSASKSVSRPMARRTRPKASTGSASAPRPMRH